MVEKEDREHRNRADWKVDIKAAVVVSAEYTPGQRQYEPPAPAHFLSEDTTEKWTGNTCNTKDRSHKSHESRHLWRRDDDRNNDIATTSHTSTTGALDCSPDDQCGTVLRDGCWLPLTECPPIRGAGLSYTNHIPSSRSQTIQWLACSLLHEAMLVDVSEEIIRRVLTTNIDVKNAHFSGKYL